MTEIENSSSKLWQTARKKFIVVGEDTDSAPQELLRFRPNPLNKLSDTNQIFVMPEELSLFERIINQESPELPVQKFTQGEREIMELLRQDLSNKDISISLGISDKTVRNRLTTIYQKLGAKNRTDAIAKDLK